MAYYDFSHIPDNKTIRAYCNAIIELVENHSIDDITVSMIIKKTESARSTFYRYFQDKYALMFYIYYRDIATYRYDDVVSNYVISTTQSFEKQYLNRNYYCKLSKAEGPDSFREFHKAFWYEATKRWFISYYGKEGYNSSMDLTARVFSTGLSNATIQWFLSECSSASPTEMAEICFKYIPPEIHKIMDNHTPLHE